MSQFSFPIRVTEGRRDRGSKLRCGIKSKYFLRTQKLSRSLTTRILEVSNTTNIRRTDSDFISNQEKDGYETRRKL